MALSAMAPQVRSMTSAVASSIEAAVWVAPKICACSRLNSTGSTAITWAGTGHGGALHGVHADATAADDHDGLTGLDLGGVDGRTPTGGDTAADEGGLVERDVLVDLDAAGLDRRLSCSENVPMQHMMPRSGRRCDGGGQVHVGDLAAGQQHGAEVAEVLLAGGARRATAAGRDEAEARRGRRRRRW